MINDAIRQHILSHIHDESPNEVCGLVIVFSGRQLYIRCSNIANDPLDNFEIDPIEWKNAEDKGQILAVVHSHPGDVSPSDRDRQCAEEVGLPWLIMNDRNELYELVPDSYSKPFVGRQFCWGENDCWSLVWDWFKEERGIELMDMERPEPDAWLVYPEPFINAAQHGFMRVPADSRQYGDVIAMALGDSQYPTHVAIYLSDNRILHQVYNRLSSEDVYDGYWLRSTQGVYRYAG